jgi:transcription antitermination factor NusG
MDSEAPSSLWYAIRTRPRFESAVSRNLKAKGYEEYLPTYRCRRRWSDRVKTVELPLFPGYLFCRLDIRQRLPILIIPGVMSFAGIGKCPFPVQESEILSIQQIVASGLQYEPWPLINIGQLVSVEYGPLRGLTGRVIDTKKNYRIVVSVQLLQRSVAVEIDRDCIKPVAPAVNVGPLKSSNLVLVGN